MKEILILDEKMMLLLHATPSKQMYAAIRAAATSTTQCFQRGWMTSLTDLVARRRLTRHSGSQRRKILAPRRSGTRKP